jgi:hypothetical protein
MEKRKVAVLFFGLTRSLRKIYDNLKENIFDELTNNNFTYDTFIHTYQLENPYINPWSGEQINNYDNLAYKVLNPKYYIIENQNKVESMLNINSYCLNLSDWKGCAKTPEMKRYLVRNMILALHSKKMVTSLFEKYKNEYDYVIITRPDQNIHKKINVNAFELLNNKNIIIPYEHSYYGYNDRFCISTPDVAIKYGKSFDGLKLYSTITSIVSEIYMKDYLTSLGLKIIFSPIESHLVRC